MAHYIVGIDVGNFGTKSQHSNTPSSFGTSDAPNELSNEYIIYNGLYYYPTSDRNRRMKDKTEDDYCTIISLFAVAKEILEQIKSVHPEYDPEDIQKEIDKVTDLSIGVGTPAGHFNALLDRTRQCYVDAWGGNGKKAGLEFSYSINHVTYNFSLTLKNCLVVPQDLAAVAVNTNLKSIKGIKNYIIVGIGGGTIDVIPIRDGNANIDKVVSFELGSTYMFDYIIKKVQESILKTLDYDRVEAVLLHNEEEAGFNVTDKIKELIFKFAEDFVANQVIPAIIQTARAEVDDYNVVFVGGGALVMKPYLEGSNKFGNVEFIDDINANAKAYASYVTRELKK